MASGSEPTASGRDPRAEKRVPFSFAQKPVELLIARAESRKAREAALPYSFSSSVVAVCAKKRPCSVSRRQIYTRWTSGVATPPRKRVSNVSAHARGGLT